MGALSISTDDDDAQYSELLVLSDSSMSCVDETCKISDLKAAAPILLLHT